MNVYAIAFIIIVFIIILAAIAGHYDNKEQQRGNE